MFSVNLKSIISVLFVILMMLSSMVSADKRIALVIGNADYKNAALNNPVNDATDMAKALKNTGFNVDVRINSNRKQMREAIRSFGDKLRQADVGLFYFAGHGIQIKGRNYLVPIAADVFAADEVQDESIDASAVLRKMESAGNAINIVILDACRNNPFARSFRNLDNGLARMDGPVGSFIAYATAPGSVAADGEGRNGLYTEHLLKALNSPDLTIEQTFKQVRAGVTQATSGQQVPWESSSLMGEFVFLSSPINKVIASSNNTATLSPMPAKQLLVSSNVSNAAVIVNNIKRGLINNQGVLNIENLGDDEIEIIVQAKGYQSQYRRIKLEKNRTGKIYIELLPEPLTKAVRLTTNIEQAIDDNASSSCLAGKRVIVTSKLNFQNVQGKKVRHDMAKIQSAVINSFQSAGMKFVDRKLLLGNEELNLDKVATQHNLNYLLRVLVNVRELPIKLIKTNMKTVNGNVTFELLDLNSKLSLSSVSRDFNKAGLDTKRVANKLVNKLLPEMSLELMKGICGSD